MAPAIYLTHPEVVIDPTVPVPDWGLSDTGRARMQAACTRGAFAGLGRIITSTEQKAMDAGGIVARALGLDVQARDGMGENDRSATGYLTEDEFWPVVQAFFANPTDSIRGWEKAADAQARIVRAVTADLTQSPTLFVGHGGVGSLLYAHLSGKPIGDPDTMSGGMGRLFTFDGKKILSGWQDLETFTL